MKTRLLTVMLVLTALVTMAKAEEIEICGLTITEEIAAQGNLVPTLNSMENVTATGNITYDFAKQTLLLENATIETDIHKPVIHPLGGKYTIVVKGMNTLSTTSVNPPYQVIDMSYSSDDVTITGESDGELTLYSKNWYGIKLTRGLLTIENITLNANVGNGSGQGICYNNDKGGSLVLKNVNMKVRSIYRLAGIELIDCAIVEPAGASILYDEGFKSYYVGVNNDWAFDIVISNGTTGISTTASAQNSGRRYNLQGQRVGKEYCGIVVENGRKTMK